MADKNFRVRNGLETPLIASDTGQTAITVLNGGDIELYNDLKVPGDITGSAGTSAIAIPSSGSGNNVLMYADLTVSDTLFLNGSTSGSVGLKGAAAAGSTTYTLPSADGTSGQVLSTNGSGTLSWATASGGGTALPISNSGTISAQPYSLGPGVMAMAGTFATLSTGMAQTIRYQPIYVTETCTLTEVAFYVQTATTLASCSAMIYIDQCSPNSATEWQPTGHLSGGYCGEVANITTTGTKTITGLSISLTPGAYLMAIQISNYTGTLGLRYLAGQVFTGGGYVVDLASGTTTAQTSFGRTGITYVSGTPAAVGDFTNTTPNNLAGQGYIVMTKFAKA